MIHTVKTAGGHRRLLLPDVLEFANAQGYKLIETEILGLPNLNQANERSLEVAKSELIEALVTGNETLSRQIVMELVLSDHRLCDICDEVIAYAFHQVGDLWDSGTVEVYQERRACEIVVRIMHKLRQFYKTPSELAPLAIGGSPSGDPYTLPTTMSELILRENGWRATSLGINLPFDSLSAAVRDQHPHLFWLSVSFIEDEEEFITGFNEFVDAVKPIGTAVLVGGKALTDQIRKHMNFTSFCDRMRNLEEFAQTFRRDVSLSPTDLSTTTKP
ncbi:B12-binding domain-containing protein [Planctomycetaceae bacterium]|nr:B12-binding domain-containing protein [Planctomycetaceae bacterium]